jgi:hypothetical protein
MTAAEEVEVLSNLLRVHGSAADATLRPTRGGGSSARAKSASSAAAGAGAGAGLSTRPRGVSTATTGSSRTQHPLPYALRPAAPSSTPHPIPPSKALIPLGSSHVEANDILADPPTTAPPMDQSPRRAAASASSAASGKHAPRTTSPRATSARVSTTEHAPPHGSKQQARPISVPTPPPSLVERMRQRQLALGSLVEARSADAMAALKAAERSVVPKADALAVAASARTAAARRAGLGYDVSNTGSRRASEDYNSSHGGGAGGGGAQVLQIQHGNTNTMMSGWSEAEKGLVLDNKSAMDIWREADMKPKSPRAKAGQVGGAIATSKAESSPRRKERVKTFVGLNFCR